jgi:hypothetical protein
LAFVRWLYRQGRLQSQVGIMAHVRGRMGNGAESFLLVSSSE